jgi:hypothetical protein
MSITSTEVLEYATNTKEAISNGEHKSNSSVRFLKDLLKIYSKNTETDSYHKLN